VSTQTVPGTLIATPDPSTLAREACVRLRKHVKDALREKPYVNVAISGGSTPKKTYELFAREEGIEFDRMRIFYVDDRAVPPDHERSNHRMFEEAFASRLGGRRPEIHRMRGETDLAEGAREYAELLKTHLPLSSAGVPAFDLMILGVGDDGHTASLFPGEPTVNIRDAWVAAVPESPAHEPRLTLTAPVIESARQIVILAQGKSKTPALERIWSVKGSLDETPARVVRHATGYVTWIVDREAAGL